MLLQFLVPQYKEDESIVKGLLDSISNQIDVDFKELGVIIVNDGSDVLLNDEFLKSYPFEIKYIKNEHKGVSATRNKALDEATADYVMFCDADDGFVSLLGIYNIFNNLKATPMDMMVSRFVEQARDPKGRYVYIDHQNDTTFVHGKVFSRKYLVDNKLRFNEKLLVNEDGYFINLCSTFARKRTYLDLVVYIWKWRDGSVCREDEYYVQKYYLNLIYAQEAFVDELIKRNYTATIFNNICGVLATAYYRDNSDMWDHEGLADYKEAARQEIKSFYNRYLGIFMLTPEDVINSSLESSKKSVETRSKVKDNITLSFKDWLQSL